MNTFEKYNKENPLLICKCGRKFRKFGLNKNGEKREYTRCMTCFMEDFEEQTGKYKEGYASQKDFDEANEK
jgi:hypothetical protein